MDCAQAQRCAIALSGAQHLRSFFSSERRDSRQRRSLANHGYLPRDGRNISVPMILSAAIDGFNMEPKGILQAAKFGLLSGDAPTTLDLDALKLHNLIEHDASLSRGDFALGDNLHFNESIFSTLLDSNPGVDYYNATSAGQVQHDRLAASLATNPNITNTPKEFALRTRESSLYLTVMGNPITGVAPKKFVQIFFREERLPIAEGWKRSPTTITAESLATIDGIIMDNSNWTGARTLSWVQTSRSRWFQSSYSSRRW
ncbi:Peroxidase, family 2-domain-containing protein [Mycena filopes]|nr:Peroxidase, family 2-domain-containing protein [Mycena filopes]